MADFKINGKNVVTQSGVAEPVVASNVTGGSGLNAVNAAAVNAANIAAGVLPVGVTGGSGLTALGTVASGNLSNSAIVYPVGHVVQVTYNSEVDDYGFSATGGTWYTIITTVITPHNKGGSDSKILVLVDAPGLWIPSGTSHNYMRIQRAGSSITAGGDTGMYFGSAAYTSHWIIYNPSVAFMDSPSIPATPVAISYTFQIKMSVTGGVYVPNSHGNISITLMEIIQ